MITEVQRKINDYIKITCQDIFFDVLQQDFNIQGLVKFYQTILHELNVKVYEYFTPLERQIQKNAVVDATLFEPIDIVLRKTYQTNYMNISDCMESNIDYIQFCKDIQSVLQFDPNASQTVLDFLKSSYDIVYMCYICDPKIYIDINQMGKSVKYNVTTHEALDGFIKQEQDCIIILPAFYRGNKFDKDTIIVKSQVLAENYFQD